MFNQQISGKAIGLIIIIAGASLALPFDLMVAAPFTGGLKAGMRARRGV